MDTGRRLQTQAARETATTQQTMSTGNADVVEDSADGPSDDDGGARAATDNEGTPSQYKMARRAEMDAGQNDGDDGELSELTLDSATDHDIPDASTIDKEAALKFDTRKCMHKMHRMSKQLEAIMKIQTVHKSEMAKRGEMQPPSSFSPRRKSHRPVVPPTDSEDESDDDDDDDSSVFSLSSSCKTPRKKLQAVWRLIGTKMKADCSPQDIQTWLEAKSKEEMVKAGAVEEMRPGKNELGGFRRAHVRVFFNYSCILISNSSFGSNAECCCGQDYKSRKPGELHGFIREQFNCPYRLKCDCFVAISVRTFSDKVQLFVSGEHTKDSHASGKGILTVKQRSAIETSVLSHPLALGSQVRVNLKNLSPGKHVPCDRRSRNAVDRLVRQKRKMLMASRVPGVAIDDTEGAMTRLSQSLSFLRHINKHNDPADPFHFQLHEPYCLGYQFEGGVTFMCLATPDMLLNAARLVNCGWQKQAHWDGLHNLCVKQIAMIGIGVNSLGSRFNPLSLSIVNSESKDGVETSWAATELAFFSIFKSIVLCDDDECSFCAEVRFQGSNKHMIELLLSDDGKRNYLHIDKPSSDGTNLFFPTARKLFGPDVLIQKCGQHISGTLILISEIFVISEPSQSFRILI